MLTEAEWESVLLATCLNKMLETACAVVSVYVSSVLLHCLCGKRCSPVILWFFSQLTKHAFPAGLTLFPFSKLLIFPFFPFSNFEYKRNFFHLHFQLQQQDRMSLLLSVLVLLYPSLWIHASWGTAWAQAHVMSSSTWCKNPTKIAWLCELESVSYISVVQNEGKSWCKLCWHLLCDRIDALQIPLCRLAADFSQDFPVGNVTPNWMSCSHSECQICVP